MRPAVGIYQPRQFLFYQMILGKTIRNQNPFIILIEVKRQLMISTLLVLVDDNRTLRAEFTYFTFRMDASREGVAILL